jgi:RNA ligase
MELQKYLRDRGLESLCEHYQIKANRHQQYPHLVCLKYSQLNSPLGEKIVQQCRGIILDENADWQIVSYPYAKFFNYGESQAATIDWNSATVYDKLDGSLMTLYYYDREWRVGSSGTPDGTGQVNSFKLNFAELFWKVWQELDYQLPEPEKIQNGLHADEETLLASPSEYCFMFELMTPFNRIVVKQSSNQLVLHGVRNCRTLVEEDPTIWANKYNWQVAQLFPLTNWQEIIKAAAELDPMDSEGYIVCDRDFNRVKVKSPQYVAIAHLRDSFSSRKMIEIVLENEGEEFLNYYPEWTDLYQKIKIRYQNLITEIEFSYQQHRDISEQKEFAIKVKNLPYSGILFALRAGKTNSIKESLANTSITKVEQLLGQRSFRGNLGKLR